MRRRHLANLLVWTVLGASAGCHHTAGVCDCDPGPHGHLWPAAAPAGEAIHPAVPAGEVIRPVPAEDSTGPEPVGAPKRIDQPNK